MTHERPDAAQFLAPAPRDGRPQCCIAPMDVSMTLQRSVPSYVGAMLLGLVACAPVDTDELTRASVYGGAGGALAGAGAGGQASGASGGTAGVGGGAAGTGSSAQGGGVPTSGSAGDPGIGGGGAGATGTGGAVESGGAGMTASGAGGLPSGGGAGAGGAAGGGAGAENGAGAQGGAGAGTGGVPAAGTAGTAGALAGCPAGAFMCEGFEAHPAGAAPGGTWTRDARGGGQILVETSRPFSGSKGLHVTGTMNADRANIRTPLAVAADTVFVRFMMYTAGYPSSSGVHTRLLRLGTTAGTAAGTPENSYAFANYNGTAIEKVNSIYLRDTGTHLNDAGVKNRWVCWEFEIDKTGGVGKVKPHIWLDGRELPLSPAGSSSHGMTSTSWDPIPIEVLILGLDGFQSDPVRADFWVDDLVVHSQRVGCPSP
jgi:hypothetical protein